jgi:hypothetical protein
MFASECRTLDLSARNLPLDWPDDGISEAVSERWRNLTWVTAAGAIPTGRRDRVESLPYVDHDHPRPA